LAVADPLAWLRRLLHGPPDDCVEIMGEADWFARRFRMDRCGGRDQVARQAEAGWMAFEAPMPRYFAEAVRSAKDGLILDVGANTGFYSLLALSVSREARIVAYEPLESVRLLLHRNLRLNKVQRKVTVLPYAASNANGQFTLFVPQDRYGLVETSASLSSAFKNEAGSEQSVTTKTLDSMHLDGRSVGLIKIDAESHDLEVLRGATQLMIRDRPTVFVEVLAGADEQGLTEILQRCGYRDFVLFAEGASAPNDVVVHETLAWNHMWMPVEG
jgi:FkbM family methyltransferase